jgi:glycosyltransferase involved in cell wall biosynthesis
MADFEKSPILRRVIPFVLRCASCVVCQGQHWRDYFQRIAGLSSERLPVIRNWIRARDYAAIPSLTPRTEPVVLFLGWVEKNKGVYELVEAVSRFRGELGHARFLICGSGSEVEPLRKAVALAGMADSFEFRGWVCGAEKMKALEQCDLLVLPSHREGFPNVLLEAMAAGRAVLATAVGAIPELVIPEETGLLCRPGDPHDLGSKLVQLCRDAELRLRLAHSGKRHVLEFHDIDKLWQVWRTVLTDDQELCSVNSQ